MERKEGSDDGSPRDSEASPLAKWTEERERYDEIAEYIRQVDEILDFIKPFPRERCPDPGERVQRSHSQEASDHLENLIKLVEQLKDLKEKDSKMNERTQYLKDLKKIRERKKLLKCEAEAGASASYWGDAGREEDGTGAAEEDAAHGRTRSSLAFRKTTRGRSKSVNADEIGKDARFRRERFPSRGEEDGGGAGSVSQRRKLSTGSQKTDKSKVSKWTKVKEAFRWERASVEGKAPGARRGGEEVQYLQVPQDKTPESLSDSPLSGQVSGSSSVGAPSTICLAVSSGYSGEHSSEGHSTSSGYGMDLPPPPPPLPVEDDFLSLPLGELSSSSSSEKLDELLTYSELLAKGNDRSDLIAAESFDVAFHDDPSTDDLDARRSKSLDGDAALGQSPSSLMQHLSKESLKTSKSHKTAWGKVKDIIQTRKGSLKKKPKKREGEKGCEAFSSQSGLDQAGQEEASTPEDKPKDSSMSPKPRIELTESTEDVAPPPSSPTKPSAADSVAMRRLTPVLTITLPSTEELRNLPPTEVDAAKQVPEEKGRVGGESLDFFEDIPRYEKSKTGSYHRFSKWSKVKRAFLTNPRSSEFVPEASSVPSSPNKQMSFFSDVESDELSSGEWTDYKVHIHDKSHPEAESPSSTFQDDIQKHYMELNHKLTQEFDQKLREWERMKFGDAKTKREGILQKQKSEDWDKNPRLGTRQRDSMAIPLPKLDDLSPEFKKKLDEWKKIKKSQTISAVPGTPPKDEAQGQNFKMRIGEWQRWRPRGNHKMTKSEQSEDFAKKLEEWQRIKGSVRRSRSQSERGKEKGGNRTPSPRLRRKSSKKSSGKSSGTESLSGSLKEKDGRGGTRKQQKEKDLHWLEKELHKIERGKMRLEREREKFLEREARLEKMKRTMGTTSPTQEILIKTPTGFFRFEGISQKFTKKLYEWEKARGIAPEASTFALLEEYVTRTDRDSNGMSLQRSKSMGSVMEVSSAVQDLPHHPSSLSLNDVDELDVGGIDESRASSEPTLPGMGREEDEPQAIIVDVEDVVEETAALMADEPAVREEVPVYSYAPTEVTQLIDSSGSESETEIKILGQSREELKPEVTGSSTRKLSDDTEEEECEDDSAKHSPGFPEGLNHQEAVTRVHELSSQLLCLAEKLELALNDRAEDGKTGRSSLYSRRRQANCLKAGGGDDGETKDWYESRNPTLQELEQLPSLITNKVLELKCGLSVLKSATESPSRDTPVFDYPIRRGGSQEFCGEGSPRHARKLKRDGEETEEERARGLEKSKAQVLFGETAAREYDKHRDTKNSPELIKRRIKEKISLMQRMTTETRARNFQPLEFERRAGEEARGEAVGSREEEEEEEREEKVVVVRKGGRQKRLLKTRRVTDTTIAYKQVVEENREEEESRGKSFAIPVSTQRFAEEGTTADKTPVNVFVPTTRKIISPVRRDSKGTPSILSYVIDDIAPKEEAPAKPPVSPGVARKGADPPPREKGNPERRDIGIPPLPSSPLSPRKLTSPGIRLMIAKYNQKIEQGSGSDGGTSSPSWRSPMLDRKFKESVHKSASVGLIANDVKASTPEPPRGILKSSSAGAVKEEPERTELSLRALRIKKAKEEFLSRGPGGEGYASAASTPTAELPSNRLSHVSVGSESSYDESFDSNLIKSASAGTINVDDGSRRSSDVDRGEEGGKAAGKSSKFGISSIRSRFRKVRMKKAKEKGSGGAVSALCRQSLLLEVPIGSERLSSACTSKSCPSSPVLERSKSKSDSWRRMFKKETKPEVP